MGQSSHTSIKILAYFGVTHIQNTGYFEQGKPQSNALFHK
jgi:hypothetical protein